MALVRREAVIKNIPGVLGVLNALPKETYALLREAFQKDGLEFDGRMQDRFKVGFLTNRSGRLRGSISTSVPGRTLKDLKLRAYSLGVPYAKAQEKGAIIKPVRKKFLAIPGPDNLTADAGDKIFPSAYDFIEKHKKNVTILRSKKHGKLLVIWRPRGPNRKKKKERGKIMFILTKRAVLPGPTSTQTPSRLGFFDTWDSLKYSRVSRHAEALTKAVERVRRMKLSNIRAGKTKNVRTLKF